MFYELIIVLNSSGVFYELIMKVDHESSQYSSQYSIVLNSSGVFYEVVIMKVVMKVVSTLY